MESIYVYSLVRLANASIDREQGERQMQCSTRLVMFLIFASFFSADALAHERPFHHKHPKKQMIIKKKKPTKVIVEREREVIYVERDRPRSTKRGNTYVTLRALGLGMGGEKLGLSPYENSSVGGLGFGIRGMVDRSWGVEFAVDFLGGGQLDFSQRQVPLQLSFLHYFMPRSKVRPYVVGGGGVQFTTLSYANGAYGFEMTEVINHLGVGAMVKLGSRLSLSTDLRATSTWATLNKTLVLGEECAATGVCPETPFTVAGDRFNLGVQFMAGFSYNF